MTVVPAPADSRPHRAHPAAVVRDLQPAWAGTLAARAAVLRREEEEAERARRQLQQPRGGAPAAGAPSAPSAAAAAQPQRQPAESGSSSLDPRAGIATEGAGRSPGSQHGSTSSPLLQGTGLSGAGATAGGGTDTSASVSFALNATATTADVSVERSAQGSATGQALNDSASAAAASLSASAAADTTADLSLSRSTLADGGGGAGGGAAGASPLSISDGPRWSPQRPPMQAPPPKPPPPPPPMTDEERTAALAAGGARALDALFGRILATREAVALGGAGEASLRELEGLLRAGASGAAAAAAACPPDPSQCWRLAAALLSLSRGLVVPRAFVLQSLMASAAGQCASDADAEALSASLHSAQSRPGRRLWAALVRNVGLLVAGRLALLPAAQSALPALLLPPLGLGPEEEGAVAVARSRLGRFVAGARAGAGGEHSALRTVCSLKCRAAPALFQLLGLFAR